MKNGNGYQEIYCAECVISETEVERLRKKEAILINGIRVAVSRLTILQDCTRWSEGLSAPFKNIKEWLEAALKEAKTK